MKPIIQYYQYEKVTPMAVPDKKDLLIIQERNQETSSKNDKLVKNKRYIKVAGAHIE